MPYFLRFNGGYGMHAGYVPQFRASHGCIRLPARMARRFYENAGFGLIENAGIASLREVDGRSTNRT